ncbi:hypothetical protein OF364_00215 [Mycoplasma enhydrae]|uniref:hypothetical protein n=1 Tax=Mycoplasma enhydrae TaxID=2499220 RepID=UPI00197B7BAB|nr:hypothetical protein [Mycoplasma enhydrae]MBN4089452.1 hypothetical protein [Mycoplasma enhydrae]MCV3733508.1 hypothetical protein [Mycoplasma enhydrae]MCV3753244.1 hypothetical protein [Mycoplasma enhydrae]
MNDYKLAKTTMNLNIAITVMSVVFIPLLVLWSIGSLTAARYGVFTYGIGFIAFFGIYAFAIVVVGIIALVYNIIGTVKAFQANETTIGILFLLGILLFGILALIASIMWYKKTKSDDGMTNFNSYKPEPTPQI